MDGDGRHPSLDLVEPGTGRGLVGVGRGQQEAGDHQLEVQPRCRGPAQLGQRRVRDVGRAGELGRAEQARLLDLAGDLVVGGVDQPEVGGVRDVVQDDQVAEPLEQVGDEPARVVAGVDHLVDDA